VQEIGRYGVFRPATSIWMKRLFLRQLHWHRQNGIDQIPCSPLWERETFITVAANEPHQ
jgi:hypothetical protein